MHIVLFLASGLLCLVHKPSVVGGSLLLLLKEKLIKINVHFLAISCLCDVYLAFLLFHHCNRVTMMELHSIPLTLHVFVQRQTCICFLFTFHAEYELTQYKSVSQKSFPKAVCLRLQILS